MCLVTLPVQFKSDTSSRREARAAPQRTLARFGEARPLASMYTASLLALA
jgi:hypothetical protein